MRVALVSLVAAVGVPAVAACKIDLDKFEEPLPVVDDAGIARYCRPSTAAASCLEAEANNVSDFAWLEANLFDRNCGGDDCHGNPVGGQPPSGTLVLATGSAFKTLMGADPGAGTPPGVQSTFSPNHKLVVPGNPEASYLFFLMRGLPPDAVTDFVEPPSDIGYMPQGNETLCCQKLDAVERWIRAGALP